MATMGIGFLDGQVLNNLKNYSGYESCDDESITTPYLRPLWRRVAHRLRDFSPAGPLIVCFGFLVFSSSLLLAAVATDRIPSGWMFLVSGASSLLYQATSAAECEILKDSKSRNTNALDVLIWQGLNTYALGTLVLNATLALGLNDPQWVFLAIVLGYSTSYIVHWQKYVSGRRKIVSKSLDISEIQLGLSAVVLMVAFTGTNIWLMPVAGSWQLNHVIIYLLAGRAGLTMLRYFNIILEGGPGEEGMTAADTAVLSPAIPLLLALLVSKSLYQKSTFDEVPYTTCVGVGILFAKITNKLVLAEVSKSPLQQLDVLYWPIFVLMALRVIGLEFEHTVITDGYVAFAIGNLVIYDYKVLTEVANHLGVSILGRSLMGVLKGH